jgi:CheY-like chemotaxis protein
MGENGGIDRIPTDIGMPERDGIEATRIVRRREQDSGAHVPIVALTANAMVQDRQTIRTRAWMVICRSRFGSMIWWRSFSRCRAAESS